MGFALSTVALLEIRALIRHPLEKIRAANMGIIGLQGMAPKAHAMVYMVATWYFTKF